MTQHLGHVCGNRISMKQIGNAVSVAKMHACVGAIMADAAPKRKETPAVLEEAPRIAAAE